MPLSADHEVIQQSDIDQRQGLLHACRYRPVRRGRLQASRRMVVEGNDGAGIQCQRPLGDFSGMNFSTVDGAPEQGFDCKNLMLGIEKQAAENLVFKMGAVGPQVVCCIARLLDFSLALQALAQDAFCCFEYLVFGVCSVGCGNVFGAHLSFPKAELPRESRTASRRPD